MNKIIPLTNLQFEISIVKHCNLKCQMCDHFSPLAKLEFLSVTSFQNDIERLASIFGNQARYIFLLGGEPTLHPQITSFMEIARNCFPTTNISIYTNGITLFDIGNDFLFSCKLLDITIRITKYPIKFNYDKLQTYLERNNIPFDFVNTHPIKTSSHYPLDIDGEQNAYSNFFNCVHSNNSITLEAGRLFTCPIIPNIYLFNNFFDKSLQITEADYINIYESYSAKEILKKLSEPIPFCKYCNIKARSTGHKWSISKCDILEWTSINNNS